jgi:hypothetical protein
MKKIYLILLLICSVSINAQNKDYIITNELDTIYGKVKRANFGILKFKKGETIIKYITIEDKITEYYSSGKAQLFEVVKTPKEMGVNSEKIFMLKIVNGKIKLFANYTQSGNSYFISKDNSNLEYLYGGWHLKLKTNSSKILRKYISDNEKVLKKFNEFVLSKPKHDEILEFINEYNDSK